MPSFRIRILFYNPGHRKAKRQASAPFFPSDPFSLSCKNTLPLAKKGEICENRTKKAYQSTWEEGLVADIGIDKIEAILKVYETQNITKAAEELYLSQQALSKTVKYVEGELGVSLFLRSARGVLPTSMGTRFYQAFAPILQQYRTQLKEFRSISQCRLRLGLAVAALRRIGSSVLNDFSQANPGIELDIVQQPDENNIFSVISGDCELSLCPPPTGIDDGNLEFIEVWREPIYIVTRQDHPLAGRKSVTIRDLDRHPIIRSRDGDFTFRATADIFRRRGLVPNFVYTIGEFELLRDIAVKKGYLFICPELHSRYVPQGGVLIPITDPDFIMKEGFVFRRDITLSSQAKRLIQFVQDYSPHK